MSSSNRFNGLLIVDKPAGWTSHDVVARIRRLLGQRAVGHAGTLDPAATGVLPIAAGSALRALEFLADVPKSYRAEITLGVATDALDIDGRVIKCCPVPGIDVRRIEALLSERQGPQMQTPPVFSAIKIDGTPLYERARRGVAIEPPLRPVTIHALRLLDWCSPVLSLDIDCSKGFYVRSCARDVGEQLGSCAYLSNLVRTRVGPFDLDDAWTLDELSSAPLAEEWERIAIAPDAAALDLPVVVIDDKRVVDWEHGKRWALDDANNTGPVRVYDCSGIWLGIGEIADGEPMQLRPRKVIPKDSAEPEEKH